MSHTVLVLGAGASIPYNFPSGAELINDVIDDFPEVLKLITMFPHRNSAKAGEEFKRRIKNGGFESIDQYLNFVSEHRQMVRATIFKVLLDRETIDISTVHQRNSATKRNWYQYYFGKLMKDQHAIEDLPVQQVISFNYDRSFEFYLFHFLKERVKAANNKDIFKLLHSKFITSTDVCRICLVKTIIKKIISF